MICADPIGSAERDDVDRALDLERRVVPPRRPGRNSSATRSAQPAEVDRLAPDLHRVGVELREVEQVVGELLQALDLPAHLGDELRRSPPVGSSVLEQLDEAAEREDRRAQLVRGVGDELLARAVEPRQAPLHLVEAARQLAELVGGVDRDRLVEVALGDRLGGRPPAGAAAARRAPRAAEPIRRKRRPGAISPAIRIWRSHQGDVVVRRRRAGSRAPSTQRGSPSPSRSATAELPDARRRRRCSTPRRDLPARDRCGGGQDSRPRERCRLDCESATTNGGRRPRPARRGRRAASPGVGLLGGRADQPASSGLGAPRLRSALREPRRLLVPSLSSRCSFSAVRLESSCGTT